MIGTSSSGASPGGESGCHEKLEQKHKLKKHNKSAIQLELDVNGVNDEEVFQAAEIDQYQPSKTPSVLCSQTHFHIENWDPQTIIFVVNDVLSRCEEISYEYVDADFKVSDRTLLLQHHLLIPIYSVN